MINRDKCIALFDKTNKKNPAKNVNLKRHHLQEEKDQTQTNKQKTT